MAGNDKKFDIKIGEYEVYDSGSVTAIESEPIEFKFPAFTIKIVFETSADVQQDILIDANMQANYLTIKLLNFNNPFGTESTFPINVATLNGKQLFLHFRVYAMSGSDNKLFNYTWLMKESKAVNNG